MTVHDLKARADFIAEWTGNHFRALHKIPEAGFAEFRTQAHIRAALDSLGIPYTTEQCTGTIGTITGAYPGPTVALRADIDGLPITENPDHANRSEIEGRMHACGHDAHTAIQLGAARILNDMKDQLHGTVRLIFQPAEEGPGGAEPLVKAGVLNGVDVIYGLHMRPAFRVGEIATRYGTLNASSDRVRIEVKGASGHAARPEEALDALTCAAQMIVSLQTLVSRSVSPLKPAVLTLGKIEGGNAHNVVCGSVAIDGTLRATDPETREMMMRRIREICEGVAAAMGAEVEVSFHDTYQMLINNDREVDRVLKLSRELLGEENVYLHEFPSMGSEDFSYYAREIPAALYHVGNVPSLPAAPLHNPNFLVDERCLQIGVALQCALVLDYMKEAQA